MTNKDQHPAILYKYIDTTGGLSMLQKEELWFRRTGFLNDPYDCYLSHECQGKYPEFSVSFDLNELTKYFGICSLSETATTFLMWSYYNEHKGMCIGVNMKDIYTSLINHFHDKINSYLSFRKVVYKNKLPDLNLINIVPFDYQTPRIDNTPSKKAQNEINGFLSTKAKWWEHEKEYRLILRQTPRCRRALCVMPKVSSGRGSGSGGRLRLPVLSSWLITLKVRLFRGRGSRGTASARPCRRPSGNVRGPLPCDRAGSTPRL